jgi:hypothetical protein
MGQTILFPEWRDETKQIKYPFSDYATMTNGVLELPNWLFLDARFYPIGGTGRFYISKISKIIDTVTFTLADDTGDLATGSYIVATPPDNGEIAFTDDYNRPVGLLLTDSVYLGLFGAMGQGIYEFTADQSELTSSVVIPQPNTVVRGIVTADDDIFTGDVWLVGEKGVVLREEDGNIRVDVVGDAFATRALCETEEPLEEGEGSVLTPYCPVMTINGYPPDQYGNFEFSVGSNESITTILRIVPSSGGTLRVELMGERRFRGIE